jgi:hypothetical protein
MSKPRLAMTDGKKKPSVRLQRCLMYKLRRVERCLLFGKESYG